MRAGRTRSIAPNPPFPHPMKFLRLFRFPLSLLLPLSFLTAAETPPRPPTGPAAYVLLAPAEIDHLVAAVRAADDERTAATVAAAPARLDAIFSDQLHYAHSNGMIDTKASYIDSLVSGRSDYVSFEHVTREFVPAGPGIVLMKGRSIIMAGPPGQPNRIDLNYLAVWREEGGQWRFLAWQSCRNPPPAAK